MFKLDEKQQLKLLYTKNKTQNLESKIDNIIKLQFKIKVRCEGKTKIQNQNKHENQGSSMYIH